MCVQAKFVNWNFKWPGRRVATKQTKPGPGGQLRTEEPGKGGLRLTKDVEDEADEAMMGGEGQQHLVDEDDVLEVVDDALAVEKVHCAGEPVPVEALGGADVARATGDGGDGDDFLEADNLDGGDDGDDVDVADEEGGEEQGQHAKGPEGARHKVCPFLLVFFLGRWLLLRVNMVVVSRFQTLDSGATHLLHGLQLGLGLGLCPGARRGPTAVLAAAEAGPAALGATGVAVEGGAMGEADASLGPGHGDESIARDVASGGAEEGLRRGFSAATSWRGRGRVREGAQLSSRAVSGDDEGLATATNAAANDGAGEWAARENGWCGRMGGAGE